MWLWLWLCRRYVGRYVRRYVHRYVVRYVARSPRGGRGLGPFAPGFVHAPGLVQLAVDATVAKPPIVGPLEKRQNGRLRVGPFVGCHARGAGKRFVTEAQGAAVAPIGHDEMKISAAFGGGQVRSVSQIIGDVQRHPSSRFSGHA